VSERTTRIAKALLVLEDTPTYRLSGETGRAGRAFRAADWVAGRVCGA
jgi:hypothetical protein